MDPNAPVSPTNPEPQGAVPQPQPTIITPSAPTPISQPPDYLFNQSVPPVAQPIRPFVPPNHPLFNNSLPAQPQNNLPNNFPQQEPPKRRRFLSKKIVLIALIPLLLIGAGAGAYLGLIAPNQPKNIWGTALSRTGKGYDKLAEYAAKQKSIKGVTLKGSFKATGGLAVDGTFEGSSSEDNGEYKGSVSATGLKIGVDLKTISSPGNSPDIYFKVDGLQGLGTLLGGDTPELTKALNSLNNQWYFVDHTLFDQISPGANTSTQITSEDVGSILKAVGDATKEYIFTDNTSKAAIVLKQAVGKESQDGRSVYHYKAGINKENLKKYADKLCSNLKSSKLSKFLGSDSQITDQALGCDSLKTDIDGLSESKTADVWVDTKTKLLHKVKFNFIHTAQKGDTELFPGDVGNSSQSLATQTQDSGYVEIYQNYTGGDEFPFGLNYQRESSQPNVPKTTTTANLDFKINMKTNTFDMTGKAGSDQAGIKSAYNFNLTITPNSAAVQVQKPDKSKTIIELLNDLGFGDFFGGGVFADVTTNTKDTERKTDINALHGQLEAYQAQNGVYPTLANVNDAAWRQQNMKGLDSAALQDPDGSAATLKSTPASHVYSYQPAPAGCNNNKIDCTSYTLTATLDAGGTYVKQSLN